MLAAFASLALALAATGSVRRAVIQHRATPPRIRGPRRAGRDAARHRHDGDARGPDDDADRPRGRHRARRGADADDGEHAIRRHAARSRRLLDRAAAARRGRVHRVPDPRAPRARDRSRRSAESRLIQKHKCDEALFPKRYRVGYRVNICCSVPPNGSNKRTYVNGGSPGRAQSRNVSTHCTLARYLGRPEATP